jgi:hypothetical protein
MSTTDYHVKVYAPHGLSEVSVAALGAPLPLPPNGPEAPVAHHIALALLSAYDGCPLSFGVCCLGWAQPEYADELAQALVGLQSMTAQTEGNLVTCEGASYKFDNGVMHFLYAFPLADLPQPQIEEIYRKVSPLGNADRTHQILNACYQNFVHNALIFDTLGILCVATAVNSELCERKLDAAMELLANG